MAGGRRRSRHGGHPGFGDEDATRQNGFAAACGGVTIEVRACGCLNHGDEAPIVSVQTAGSGPGRRLRHAVRIRVSPREARDIIAAIARRKNQE